MNEFSENKDMFSTFGSLRVSVAEAIDIAQWYQMFTVPVVGKTVEGLRCSARIECMFINTGDNHAPHAQKKQAKAFTGAVPDSFNNGHNKYDGDSSTGTANTTNWGDFDPMSSSENSPYSGGAAGGGGGNGGIANSMHAPHTAGAGGSNNLPPHPNFPRRQSSFNMDMNGSAAHNHHGVMVHNMNHNRRWFNQSQPQGETPDEAHYLQESYFEREERERLRGLDDEHNYLMETGLIDYCLVLGPTSPYTLYPTHYVTAREGVQQIIYPSPLNRRGGEGGLSSSSGAEGDSLSPGMFSSSTQPFGADVEELDVIVYDRLPRQDHPDVELPGKIEWFACPEGSKTVLASTRPEPYFTSFVLSAGGDTSEQYGLSINFFVDVSIVDHSDDTRENSPAKSGTSRGTGRSRATTAATNPGDVDNPLWWHPKALEKETVEERTARKSALDESDKNHKWTTCTICLLFRYPFMQQITDVLKYAYKDCLLPRLSEWETARNDGIRNQLRETHRKMRAPDGTPQTPQSNAVTMDRYHASGEIKPFPMFVEQLMAMLCLECPLPVPGLLSVKLQLNAPQTRVSPLKRLQIEESEKMKKLDVDSTKTQGKDGNEVDGQSVLFSLPRTGSLPHCCYPMEMLLKFFKPRVLIDIVCCVMSECRLVFHSNDLSKLPIVCETLRTLIYPLKWTHVYLPIVPVHLLNLVEAPVPFMLGTHSKWIKHIHLEYLADVVVVDCDTGAVDVGLAECTHFPDLEDRWLMAGLRTIDTPPTLSNDTRGVISQFMGHKQQQARKKIKFDLKSDSESEDRTLFNRPLFINDYTSDEYRTCLEFLTVTNSFHELTETIHTPTLTFFYDCIQRVTETERKDIELSLKMQQAAAAQHTPTNSEDGTPLALPPNGLNKQASFYSPAGSRAPLPRTASSIKHLTRRASVRLDLSAPSSVQSSPSVCAGKHSPPSQNKHSPQNFTFPDKYPDNAAGGAKSTSPKSVSGRPKLFSAFSQQMDAFDEDEEDSTLRNSSSKKNATMPHVISINNLDDIAPMIVTNGDEESPGTTPCVSPHGSFFIPTSRKMSSSPSPLTSPEFRSHKELSLSKPSSPTTSSNQLVAGGSAKTPNQRPASTARSGRGMMRSMSVLGIHGTAAGPQTINTDLSSPANTNQITSGAAIIDISGDVETPNEVVYRGLLPVWLLCSVACTATMTSDEKMAVKRGRVDTMRGLLVRRLKQYLPHLKTSTTDTIASPKNSLRGSTLVSQEHTLVVTTDYTQMSATFSYLTINIPAPNSVSKHDTKHKIINRTPSFVVKRRPSQSGNTPVPAPPPAAPERKVHKDSDIESEEEDVEVVTDSNDLFKKHSAQNLLKQAVLREEHMREIDAAKLVQHGAHQNAQRVSPKPTGSSRRSFMNKQNSEDIEYGEVDVILCDADLMRHTTSAPPSLTKPAVDEISPSSRPGFARAKALSIDETIDISDNTNTNTPSQVSPKLLQPLKSAMKGGSTLTIQSVVEKHDILTLQQVDRRFSVESCSDYNSDDGQNDENEEEEDDDNADQRHKFPVPVAAAQSNLILQFDDQSINEIQRTIFRWTFYDVADKLHIERPVLLKHFHSLSTVSEQTASVLKHKMNQQRSIISHAKTQSTMNKLNTAKKQLHCDESITEFLLKVVTQSDIDGKWLETAIDKSLKALSEAVNRTGLINILKHAKKSDDNYSNANSNVYPLNSTAFEGFSKLLNGLLIICSNLQDYLCAYSLLEVGGLYFHILQDSDSRSKHNLSLMSSTGSSFESGEQEEDMIEFLSERISTHPIYQNVSLWRAILLDRVPVESLNLSPDKFRALQSQQRKDTMASRDSDSTGPHTPSPQKKGRQFFAANTVNTVISETHSLLYIMLGLGVNSARALHFIQVIAADYSLGINEYFKLQRFTTRMWTASGVDEEDLELHNTDEDDAQHSTSDHQSEHHNHQLSQAGMHRARSKEAMKERRLSMRTMSIADIITMQGNGHKLLDSSSMKNMSQSHNHSQFNFTAASIAGGPHSSGGETTQTLHRTNSGADYGLDIRTMSMDEMIAPNEQIETAMRTAAANSALNASSHKSAPIKRLSLGGGSSLRIDTGVSGSGSFRADQIKRTPSGKHTPTPSKAAQAAFQGQIGTFHNNSRYTKPSANGLSNSGHDLLQLMNKQNSWNVNNHTPDHNYLNNVNSTGKRPPHPDSPDEYRPNASTFGLNVAIGSDFNMMNDASTHSQSQPSNNKQKGMYAISESGESTNTMASHMTKQTSSNTYHNSTPFGGGGSSSAHNGAYLNKENLTNSSKSEGASLFGNGLTSAGLTSIFETGVNNLDQHFQGFTKILPGLFGGGFQNSSSHNTPSHDAYSTVGKDKQSAFADAMPNKSTNGSVDHPVNKFTRMDLQTVEDGHCTVLDTVANYLVVGAEEGHLCVTDLTNGSEILRMKHSSGSGDRYQGVTAVASLPSAINNGYLFFSACSLGIVKAWTLPQKTIDQHAASGNKTSPTYWTGMTMALRNKTSLASIKTHSSTVTSLKVVPYSNQSWLLASGDGKGEVTISRGTETTSTTVSVGANLCLPGVFNSSTAAGSSTAPQQVGSDKSRGITAMKNVSITTMSFLGKAFGHAEPPKTMRSDHKAKATPSNSSANQGNDELLAVGTSNGMITLLDIQTSQPVYHADGHKGAVTKVLGLRSNMFISAGMDRSLKLWDIRVKNRNGIPAFGQTNNRSLDERSLGSSEGLYRCAASPITDITVGGWDNTLVVSASADGVLRLWDLRYDVNVPCSVLKGHSNRVSSLSWNGRDEFYSASHDGTVRSWDSISGKNVNTLHAFGADTGIVSLGVTTFAGGNSASHSYTAKIAQTNKDGFVCQELSLVNTAPVKRTCIVAASWGGVVKGFYCDTL
eukprot:gene21442-27474_t